MSNGSKWSTESLEWTSRQPGRWAWVQDACYGYARRLRDGETLAQAVEDFEAAGEPAYEARIVGLGATKGIVQEAAE